MNCPTPERIRADLERIKERRGWIATGEGQMVGQVSTPERDEIIDGIRECEPYPIAPDEAGLFLQFFVDGEGVDLATIPDTVWGEMNSAMMDAKREAGWEVLNEFVRKLAPVVEALR
jgi:hypothetical protein